MSFIDTISQKLGFTETEEEDAAEMDEELEEEEAEETETSGGIFSRIPFRRRNKGSFFSNRNEEEEEERNTVSASPSKNTNTATITQLNIQSKPHCERVIHVRQIDECREIIQYLLNGDSILLNLENADPKDCGRIVDLLSGAAYALSGRMLKIAHLSYLLAPANVEVVEEPVYTQGQVKYR
jgi:cell division inhibitor SepF